LEYSKKGGFEMGRAWAVALVVVMVMGWARAASAQDERVGLTMGYPTAVGVLWQVSDRLAIRPEFSWAHQAIENDSNFAQGTSDSSGVGVGISALVRLRQWGQVRSYVAPRFEVVRTSVETTIDLPSLFPPGFPSPVPTSQSTTTTGTAYEGGASIGVQASPAAHFGVFGEVGLMYGRSKTTGDASVLQPSPSSTRVNSVGLRSAIGVILFF
jgi:hypothetical protein